MRIIRGKYRSKKIPVLKSFKDRPTTDFGKEALFNIIENNFDIEKIKVLDVFSGTGSISLEFLSRGCKNAVAVEKNRRYTAHLQKLAEELFPENFNIITANAFKFLKSGNLDYEIIFADPPYDISGIETLPEIVFENETLKQGTIFILEHSAGYNFKENTFFDNTRKYGKVNFSFFSKK